MDLMTLVCNVFLTFMCRYGVFVDGDRHRNRPNVLCQDEVLRNCVPDQKVASTLSVGTRVAAYWSERMHCLYPGYVISGRFLSSLYCWLWLWSMPATNACLTYQQSPKATTSISILTMATRLWSTSRTFDCCRQILSLPTIKEVCARDRLAFHQV